MINNRKMFDLAKINKKNLKNKRESQQSLDNKLQLHHIQ
jgi:hypothetical protein